MIEMMHKFVMMFLESEEHGLQAWVDKVIAEFNLLLRTRASFMLPWPEKQAYVLNSTVVAAPVLDADTQTIAVAVDGRVFDKHLKTSHVEGP